MAEYDRDLEQRFQDKICDIDADSRVRSFNGKSLYTKTMKDKRAEALQQLHEITPHNTDTCTMCVNEDWGIV